MNRRRLVWSLSLGALAAGVWAWSATNTGLAAECAFKEGDAKAGAAIFDQTCIACHGEDGKGVVPGAPDFTKKGGVLTKPHAVLQDHIKNGFSSPDSPLSMPPGGGNPALTDQDIKNVHAYLHERFGCG